MLFLSGKRDEEGAGREGNNVFFFSVSSSLSFISPDEVEIAAVSNFLIVRFVLDEFAAPSNQTVITIELTQVELNSLLTHGHLLKFV